MELVRIPVCNVGMLVERRYQDSDDKGDETMLPAEIVR